MNKASISGWVRQARHRAKKYGVYNDLNIEPIEELVLFYENKCALCSNNYEVIDHMFPMKEDGPNVAANILPICKSCKITKRNKNLVDIHNSRDISKSTYLRLLREMVSRDGGDVLKEYIKVLTGLE